MSEKKIKCNRCGKEKVIFYSYGFKYYGIFCKKCARKWEKHIRSVKEKNQKVFGNYDAWHKLADKELEKFILQTREKVNFS